MGCSCCRQIPSSSQGMHAPVAGPHLALQWQALASPPPPQANLEKPEPFCPASHSPTSPPPPPQANLGSLCSPASPF